MTHYLTWADFCTPRGPLRFDLPPPNEGCSHVGDLKHGRRDYEREQLEYSRQLSAYRRGDFLEPPKHWRLKIGDKLAGICICENPEVPPCQDNGYQRERLWSGTVLYECLIESCPRLVQATHSAIEQHANMAAMRHLQGQLLSVFRNEFKTMSEQAGWNMATWPKAIKYFELSVELVSKWMLLHYEMYPLWWAPMIVRYAEVSPEWERYVEQQVEAAAIAEGRASAFTPRLKS